jgi:hypothetical protein
LSSSDLRLTILPATSKRVADVFHPRLDLGQAFFKVVVNHCPHDTDFSRRSEWWGDFGSNPVVAILTKSSSNRGSQIIPPT